MLVCKSPRFINSQKIVVNCGHCRACRRSKRKEWTRRLVHEGYAHGHKAVYCTLTYKNEYLPKNFSLDVRDLQLFFKRLRKKLGDKKIRYYACGEYCPTTQRPHYHLIIFGLDKTHRTLIYETWGKCKYAYYDFSVVYGKKAYSYVAGYTNKKIGTGWKRKEKETKRKSPFQVMSLGIGKKYALDQNYSPTRYTDRENGRTYLICRYYRRLAGITSEHIKPYIEEKTCQLRDLISKTMKVSLDCASRAVLFNNTIMQSIRELCDQKLSKNEEYYRTKIPFKGRLSC